MFRSRPRQRRAVDVANTKVSFRLTDLEREQVAARLAGLGDWHSASDYIRALILADLKDNVVTMRGGRLVAVWPAGVATLEEYIRATDKKNEQKKKDVSPTARKGGKRK